jgi:hypothetical protein
MDILRDGAVFEGTRAWRVKSISKTAKLLLTLFTVLLMLRAVR